MRILQLTRYNKLFHCRSSLVPPQVSNARVVPALLSLLLNKLRMYTHVVVKYIDIVQKLATVLGKKRLDIFYIEVIHLKGNFTLNKFIYYRFLVKFCTFRDIKEIRCFFVISPLGVM